MPSPWLSPSRNAADASWMPCRSTTCRRELACPLDANRVTCEASCLRRRPSMRGTSGPYRSASTRPTLLPCACSARARFTATVVLPTPPFPLATAIIGALAPLAGAGCGSVTVASVPSQAGRDGRARAAAVSSGLEPPGDHLADVDGRLTEYADQVDPE